MGVIDTEAILRRRDFSLGDWFSRKGATASRWTPCCWPPLPMSDGVRSVLIWGAVAALWGLVCFFVSLICI